MGSAMTHPSDVERGRSAIGMSLIEQVAAALGVPCATLLKSDEVDIRLAALEDTLKLIRFFEQIDDRQARRECIAIVKAIADRECVEFANDLSGISE